MILKDYMKNGGKIFDETSGLYAFLNQIAEGHQIEILEAEIIDRYGDCYLDYNDDETQEKNQQTIFYHTNNTMRTNMKYFQSIVKSLLTEMDFKNRTDMTEITQNEGKDSDKVINFVSENAGADTDTYNNYKIHTEGSTTDKSNTFDNAAYREAMKQEGMNDQTHSGSIEHKLGTKNTQNGTTEHEKGTKTTRTKKGYDNINPADMLKEIYESRSINIFNTIIDRIADCIIIPIYSFSF